MHACVRPVASLNGSGRTCEPLKFCSRSRLRATTLLRSCQQGRDLKDGALPFCNDVSNVAELLCRSGNAFYSLRRWLRQSGTAAFLTRSVKSPIWLHDLLLVFLLHRWIVSWRDFLTSCQDVRQGGDLCRHRCRPWHSTAIDRETQAAAERGLRCIRGTGQPDER